MTTGINPDVRPAARRWATMMLGVPENAPSAEARRAYFKKVRENDFLAPRSLHHALRVLEGKKEPAESDEERLLEEENRLRAEIDLFAAGFFSLPASQRLERWNALLSRCESASPLTARLQTLKAGLEVEVKSLPSFQGRLAEQLLQSFPLPPLAQTASRQAFLRQIEDASAFADRSSWEKAARYLRAEWPALADLDRESVQHIAKLRSRLKRKKTMRQRGQRQRATAGAVSRKRSAWWLLLAVGMLGGVLRVVMDSSSHSSQQGEPSSIYFTPHEATGLPSPESLGVRNATAAKTGASVPPSIRDLFDPSKFDVEVEGAEARRFFRFTPRPDPTAAGPNGSPLWYGEAGLRLMGVSKKQINDLVSRAATKHPEGGPKKSSEQGKKKRP